MSLFATIIAVVVLFFRHVLWWILPFLIAFAVSTLMEPVIVALQRRFRLKRGFAAALLTLTLLFLAGGILSLLGTTLLGEAYAFLSSVPSLLNGLPRLADAVLTRIDRYCAACPDWLQSHLQTQVTHWLTQWTELFDALASRLLALLGTFVSALPRGALGIATTVLAIYFTSSVYPILCRTVRNRLTDRQKRTVRLLRRGALHTLSGWLRAQAILCALTFVQLFLGFSLMHQRFPLLAAFLTTLVDALPVFGTGTVLLPWAIGCLLTGNRLRAIALIGLYAVTFTVRSIAEPRLLGEQAGLPPILSLFAMYLGFCAFGVGGMILFPILLLFTKQIYDSTKRANTAAPTRSA